MFHLSIIIADLGRFAHLGGTVARTAASSYLVIEDHHMSPSERMQFIADHVDLKAVTGVDVTVLTDIAPDCLAGLHEWTLSELSDTAAAVRCTRCGAVERTPRLPYWTGAILRAPRLPYTDQRETLDHGVD